MSRGPSHNSATYAAGSRTPVFGDDQAVRFAAEEGSRALLEALRRYFLKGGRG